MNMKLSKANNSRLNFHPLMIKIIPGQNLYEFDCVYYILEFLIDLNCYNICVL